MSGNHRAKARGGISFTPRLRKFTLHPQTPPPPVPAAKADPSSLTPAPETIHHVSVKAASDLTPNAPCACQQASKRPDWQHLSEIALWQYFLKIRDLYFIRNKPGKETPLGSRYLAIREHLFHRYYPDVLKTAQSYKRKKMPQSSLTDPEDLEQAAAMAMLKLLDKYNPEFGDGKVTFMGFANAKDKSRIQGAMTDALRTMQEFPRPVAYNRRRMKPEIRAAESLFGYSLTVEEILDVIGWQYRDVITDPLFNAGVFNQSQISSESQESRGNSDGWESEVLQLCEARHEINAKKYKESESEQKILGVIKDPEIRYIIWAYYYCGTNFQQIRKELRKAYGKRRSQTWIHTKHQEGKDIIKAAFGRYEFKQLALPNH